jgi:hypothetical protein
MIVTLEQSIHIFARVSLSRFGAKARQKTQERIEHLCRTGDADGANVHERVKRQIEEIERQRVNLQ